MATISSVLVVCADRDDDFGRKAGISGPVVGRRENIAAAAKLAIKDPEEADANAVFAAVKKYDELKKLYPNVQIVTLIGKGKFGSESDKIMNEQLDRVLEKFPADGFVLVTDGAEDDQILPILQSRGKVVGKETVVIKQAKEVEGTVYAVKEALRDPLLSKIFIGIPGLILLTVALLPNIGIQLVFAALGALLLFYGFGAYDFVANFMGTIAKSITTQRASFLPYLACLFIFGFGIFSAYNQYSTLSLDFISNSIEALMQFVFYTLLSGLFYLVGKSMDSIHTKRAYLLRNYFLTGVAVAVSWFILDAGRNVFVGKADLYFFIIVLIVSSGVFYVAYQFARALDIRKKVTALLIGFPVYSRDGKWIGKVEKVEREKQSLEYKLIPKKGKELLKAKMGDFRIKRGRIELLN